MRSLTQHTHFDIEECFCQLRFRIDRIRLNSREYKLDATKKTSSCVEVGSLGSLPVLHVERKIIGPLLHTAAYPIPVPNLTQTQEIPTKIHDI